MSNILLQIIASVSEKELTEWAERVIDVQFYLTQTGIVSIVGIATLGLIIWSLYNFLIIRYQLKKVHNEINTKMILQLSEIKQSLTTEINKLKNKSEKEIEKMLLELQELKSDSYRLFAFMGFFQKMYTTAALWASRGIKHEIDTQSEDMLRPFVNLLSNSLKKCDYLETQDKKEIGENIKNLPEYCDTEKKKIMSRIKKLPAKSPDSNT